MTDDNSAQEGAEGNEDIEAAEMLAEAAKSQEDDGDKFDADTAKAKISKANREARQLRERLKQLEPLAEKAKELEDANKTELEKLTERASGAEDRATSAELRALRMEVALDKAPDGMPVTKIRALAKRLTGSTQEELEADAEELFAEFAPASDASTNGDGRPKETLPKVPLPNSENLRLDDETDPRKLAARLPRM